MENEHLIAIEEFCIHYKVEPSFIYSLVEFQLVEVVTVEEKKYLSKDQLREVEKMIRMHYDLDINVEGIEAISHLLRRMDILQEELTALKNKIS
ncbi:MAG TPA: chaperone modulator CbpM [Cyclobacteriaceae bacterium]|jgi:hypothetical protein|nr:chaperone modulator CbpM [Cyclobacteriaceae bacterium]